MSFKYGWGVVPVFFSPNLFVVHYIRRVLQPKYRVCCLEVALTNVHG